MIYSCLIVDDNEIERDVVEMHLKKIPSLNIVAICSNGVEASQILSNTPIDIVFSDIDMPDLSGMELLKTLKNHPQFVFITSFSEYAAESFNLDAIDFIVKPASFKRILKAVNKAIEYIELKKGIAKEPIEEKPIAKEPDSDFFYFRETKGISKLRYDDVIYIESMGDFSKIFTNSDKHIILVSLKNLEKQLPELLFSRVHKQYIINNNHIVTLTNHEVHLVNDFIVPISAANRQELLEKTIDKKILSRFIK
ncbi:LytR/AlgR family response regulator transcription factor [Pedobacter endophyticus]|uniref:Response regulator transcription factor n=1 Tax=Pedobacter endophyticus TaxID=2789740 RepID=A0A7S9Q0I8_9SPHI|nr:LytTR family DNA-binding domain-containing protein [Pedobacter endophyticus]QPH40732.1 response regulator transcription factor [Pedobacter endophyticus]